MKDKTKIESLRDQAVDFAQISLISLCIALTLLAFQSGDLLLKHYKVMEYFFGDGFYGFGQLTISALGTFGIIFVVVFVIAQIRVLKIQRQIANLKKGDDKDD